MAKPIVPHTVDMFSPNTSSLSPVQFGSKIRRVQLNNETYFSIIDIFEHYGSKGSAAAPDKYWTRILERLRKQGVSVSDEVRTHLSNHLFEGSKRPTPVGTVKLFMRIAQVSEIKEWEKIRDWMAGLAVERIEETANPELGITRAQDRFLKSKMNQGMTEDEAKDFLILVQEGHISRRQWTDVLRGVVRGVIQYGTITDAQYIILFGMKAKQMKEVTGFKIARDGMTVLGRQITNACDIALMDEFKRHDNLTFNEAVELTKIVAADFSPTIQRIQKRTGVSLATGQRLMGRGS